MARGVDPSSGEARDPPATEVEATLHGGLQWALTIGLPLMGLWTLAGWIADWRPPAMASPWGELTALGIGAAVLMVSVRGMLRWAESTIEPRGGTHSEDDAGLPSGPASRPCIDCPS